MGLFDKYKTKIIDKEKEEKKSRQRKKDAVRNMLGKMLHKAGDEKERARLKKKLDAYNKAFD